MWYIPHIPYNEYKIIRDVQCEVVCNISDTDIASGDNVVKGSSEIVPGFPALSSLSSLHIHRTPEQRVQGVLSYAGQQPVKYLDIQWVLHMKVYRLQQSELKLERMQYQLRF